LFPADFNTAAAVMEFVFQTRGQIWTLVVPKSDALPNLFSINEARQLLKQGAARA
jgi:phosphoketolase